jgi:hypothetical protein
MQQTVNKTLASKMLVFEKQCQDERRKRQDLERMLASQGSNEVRG